MKVAFVIGSLEMGGAERVVCNLSNHWSETMDVVIITLSDTSSDAYPLKSNIRRIGLGLIHKSQNIIEALLRNAKRIISVRSLLHKLSPDIVIGVMPNANVVTVLASLGLHHSVIITEHIHPPMLPIDMIWERLRRLTYPMADCLIVPTQETSLWVKKHWPKTKVFVIPNPIVLPIPHTKPYVPLQKFISKDKKVLFAVGRFVPQKGFDILIDAFSNIANDFKTWDLIIAGDGPERARMEDKVVRLNLKGRIHFPGRIGNIQEWYERADLFVLSSRFEGFAMVLAEAMACGAPAVSFDCKTGPSEIIRHGVDGLLVPLEGGSTGLASALSQLMADELKRDEMRKNARDVANRFSIVNITKQWKMLFEKLDKRKKM